MAASARALNAVVAYPGVMPAAIEVARAFAERGMLARYETTLAYRPDQPFDRAVGRGVRLVLGARAEQELRRRAIEELAGERVRRRPAWDGLRAVANRLGAGEVVLDRIWERMVLDYDARVARRLAAGDGLVYGFEHACRRTLQRAAELGIHGVLDMAAPHFTVSGRVLSDEVAAFPETRTAYSDAMRGLEAERNHHKQDEFERAALIVANSQFTARSLEGTGVASSKVRVVPLGAPEVDPSWRQRPRSAQVRVLFAGSVSIRKGAHLLLAAWRTLAPGSGAELLLAGQWLLPKAALTQMPGGVRALGSVTRTALYDCYRDASVLVLPSLLDGFGMVVTEALAHGLPVITTRNTGAADLIEEGKNGWVIAAGDPDALASRLQYCFDHGDELAAMREAAERSAARRPWSVYRRELVEAVSTALPV